VYVYTDNGSTYSLSRSADTDTYQELINSAVFVLSGTIYQGSGWLQTNKNLTSFSGQIWTQTAGAVSYSGGTGISITGNVISNTGVTSLVAGTNISVSAATGAVTVNFSGVLPVANGGTGGNNASTARTNLSAAASGTNNDITSLTGITGGISTADYLDFDVNATVTNSAARLYWDNSLGTQTLALGMSGGSVVQHIGQRTYYRVRASSTITAGQVVMKTGTQGSNQVLLAAPATGLTVSQNERILGIATENISTNSYGYIVFFGTVSGFNTTGGAESWIDGDVLYYNPAVAGGLTKNAPSAPNPKVIVATVLNASATGSLHVRPIYGSQLGETDSNVQISGLADNNLLQYYAAGPYWRNVTSGSVSVGAATNLVGGSAGSLPYQTAASTTTLLGIGAANTVLTSTGTAPQWSTGLNLTSPSTISVNSSSDGLRITQAGSGNALLVEDSTNPDATPFVVNSNGQLGLGVTGSAIPVNTAMHVVSDGTVYNIISFQRSESSSSAFSVNFQKSRGTPSSQTIVVADDQLGTVLFNGYDGANNIPAASIAAAVDSTPGTNDMPGRLVFSTTGDEASTLTERMRIRNDGNVAIGSSGTSDTKLAIEGYRSNAGSGIAVRASGQITSSTTVEHINFSSQAYTQVGSFTLGNLRHFNAAQPTNFSAGSSVTNQYGFEVSSNLTGATNNYGFYSGINNGLNRYNFYAAGNADNYFSGKTGIGILPYAASKLGVGGAASGAITYSSVETTQSVQSDVTNAYNSFSSFPSTQATAFTLSNLRHYVASQGTFGVGSVVTNQFGFFADDTLIGATNDYGFYSNIAIGAARWNFYSNGTAENYFAGKHNVAVSARTSPTAFSTTSPSNFYSGSGTVTDSATLTSGTVAHGTINSFDNPSIAATNATVTYTIASTVYIDGAPQAGTNVTITNPYALYVAAGNSYFAGTLTAAGGISGGTF
jgi:hypothetical protein